MPYTPVELRHVRVSRSLLGYNRAKVEQMIEEVADSFETAWRERGELADRVEALDDQIVELAALGQVTGPNILYTVGYEDGPRQNPSRPGAGWCRRCPPTRPKARSDPGIRRNHRSIAPGNEADALTRSAIGA